MAAEYKRKTASCRDQQERADLASFVMPYAIASNSLAVVEDAVIWLRRFNRDPLTVYTVYRSTTLRSTEMVELLSGARHLLDNRFLSMETIKSHTQHANRILMLLLETACMTLREPAFQADSWGRLLGLFNLVTNARAKNIGGFQEECGLSDELLYESVFVDTLEMLLTAERIGLEEQNAPLKFDKTGGPSSQYQYIDIPNMTQKVVCRFIDELAESRNALWERHRTTLRPATVTLPEPWTRGLPIQYLVTINRHIGIFSGASTNARVYADAMPYLFSRVKKVVFVDSECAQAALPEDDETKAAMGTLSDDYKLALFLYTRLTVDGESTDTRVDKAWQHALHKLSDPTLSEREAALFWRDVFQSAGAPLPSATATLKARRDPTIADVDDASEPTDWNPDPDYEVSRPRDLKVRCLDRLLQPGRADWPVNLTWSLPSPVSPRVVHQSIWNSYPLWRLVRPNVREALIAATLLWINSKKCPNVKILESPFPIQG